MIKNLKTLSIITFTFILGLGINNFAMSETNSTIKIGVVDIQKLLDSSTEIKTLKQEQLKKREEIQKLAKTATEDIQKQSTEENQKKLAMKYKELIATKNKANTELYTKKLSEIDSKISSIINKKAKSSNYDIILVKDNVLYGGEDITSDISKELNKK